MRTIILHRMLIGGWGGAFVGCDIVAVLYRSVNFSLLGQLALLCFMVSLFQMIQEHKTKATRTATISSGSLLHPIDQEQYAALLRNDEDVRTKTFRQLKTDDKNLYYHCIRCQRRAARVTVTHPILDGPFDDAGSGRVDVRHLLWCARCDGPPPEPSGSPIRLPFLDYLPIRLLSELYARPAFHQLMMPVEQYVAPPSAPPPSGGQ